MAKRLRVGLDADGVVLYNPIRVTRPLIVLIKRLFFKSRVSTFLIPKSPRGKYLWLLFHASSLWVSPGFNKLERLSQLDKVELYMITGRYSFLRSDLEKRLESLGIKQNFKKIIFNMSDQQPHVFKETAIRNLKLDVFVEDNWDIVKYIVPKVKKTKVYWIDNPLDRRIPYQWKHRNLSSAAQAIIEDFGL